MKNAKHIWIIALVLVLVMSLSILFVACDKKNDNGGGNTPGTSTPGVQNYNPETRPLALSISTPDGVFNPFFSTSAYDSAVIGQTQIGMLSTDPQGGIVCGENEPTVALDYEVTEAPDRSMTTYKFLIKNGIKFSDGEPLTIKDVLFNLYVYLDPAYTGSATIYSTHIKGLQEYRLQSTQVSDDYASFFEESFIDEANVRINDLVDYVKIFGKGIQEIYKPTVGWLDNADKVAATLNDFDFVAKTFKEELTTDWNGIDRESYKDWGFTEVWQIFLLNDGGYSDLLAKNEDGTYVKDENGNYKLDESKSAEEYGYIVEGITEAGKEVNDNTIKEYCIDSIYYSYFPEGGLTDTSANNFMEVIYYWMTSSTVRERFAAEAKTAYYEKAGDKVVPNISGITTETTTSFKGRQLDETHDVLVIKIDDVDPKAIYNFAFGVAPMHYYSTTNYKGHNYIAEFDGVYNFGLEFGDINFMNEVINKNVGLPVGAGPYKASNQSGSGTVTAENFWNNNMIYYERNTYFETVGKELSNAKIKYMKYKVVESDQIINALINGDIDFGDPNATQDNRDAVVSAGLGYDTIKTAGYGYVGINPRFVPNIQVRRAIMKAMDTNLILQNYYQGGLAEIIYRPMSKVSWAYPQSATVYQDAELGLDYRFDQWGDEIEQMVKDEGYEKINGVYQKYIDGFGLDTLDYEFTIAGGSTDHPAYSMFLKAVEILNAHGFKVKCITSTRALSDLSAGLLKVWAAAWSSTIDPDMYQVYHKDSQASSVNNWGYNQIKALKDKEAYREEYSIICELSDLIDAGRATTDQNERKEIYANALDMVMQLAVEFPTYQRNDMSAYNKNVLDESTMTPKTERSPYNGLISRIWELNYR